MRYEFPLSRLIRNRSQELGLNAKELGFRLGYRNSAKAAGRVDALCEGHIASRKSKRALDRLANALEVPEHIVEEAVAATNEHLVELDRQAEQAKRVAQEASEARWRASFKPHAVLDTEHKCPSQITICGLTGGIGRWLIVRLDNSKNRRPLSNRCLMPSPPCSALVAQVRSTCRSSGRQKDFS